MKNIEDKIKEMLKENTGVHFLDSGGAYGRNWEKNQNRDFDNEPILEIYAYSDDDVTFSINIYHYLINHLEINDKSEKYNKMFKAFIDKSDNSYLADIENFADLFNNLGTTNTYNFENLLSQVLQYTIFEDNKEDKYIILQIHGGCDVRGGYTEPYIFYLPEMDYFFIHMYNVFCTDKNGNSWYSDDCGYNWYPDNSKHELKFFVKDKKVYDKKTKNELFFNVILEW